MAEMWGPMPPVELKLGEYMRKAMNALNGRSVNALDVTHRRSCLLCRREDEPRIHSVMPDFRFGNTLIRYAVAPHVEQKQTYESVAIMKKPIA